MNFEGTITINGKNYELNENDIFQNHINISVDEFCELLEQKLLVKFELSNHILIYHQMTSDNHTAIEINLVIRSGSMFLKQKYYRVLSDAAAITTPNLDSYYLPDASIVIAKEIEYVEVGTKKRVKAISNAVGLIEILSDATEEYDRTVKYENYRQIPTLKQYILISQKEIKVESFVKNAFGEWSSTIYTSKNDYFAIIEDQFQLRVGNLYLQTSLDLD